MPDHGPRASQQDTSASLPDARVRDTRTDVKDDGIFTEVKVSDGRSVRLQAFLDSGGRLYTKVSFKRQGTNVYEEIVTTLEDGIHRYVQRGNRSSV